MVHCTCNARFYKWFHARRINLLLGACYAKDMVKSEGPVFAQENLLGVRQYFDTIFIALQALMCKQRPSSYCYTNGYLCALCSPIWLLCCVRVPCHFKKQELNHKTNQLKLKALIRSKIPDWKHVICLPCPKQSGATSNLKPRHIALLGEEPCILPRPQARAAANIAQPF